MVGGRVTLKAVAEGAGVSSATASYVLRGIDRSASPETRARIREVAERLGYRPNAAARAVRTGKTGMVVMALHRLADPWSVALGEELTVAAKRRGEHVLLLPGRPRGEDWYQAIADIRPDVAYIELLDDTDEVRSWLHELSSRGQRLVVHSETIPPDGFDVVRPRPEPGSAEIMAHLSGLTTDIAFVTTQPHGHADSARARPYLRARAAGEIAHRNLQFYDGTRSGAFQLAVELLSGADRPKAVVCNSDYAALAVIQAAHFLGLKVPEDLAVAGMDGTREGATSTPSLTTAGPTLFFESQAELVADASDREDMGAGIVHEFAWSLMARASTGS